MIRILAFVVLSKGTLSFHRTSGPVPVYLPDCQNVACQPYQESDEVVVFLIRMAGQVAMFPAILKPCRVLLRET